MRNILITGGAGFIGSNVAEYFLKKGDRVILFDNFSRNGSKQNANWLKSLGGELSIIEGDVREANEITKAVIGMDVVLHFAAQVAVTTSVTNPREDFEINTLGALNILEAVRTKNPKTIFLFSSTNKVYGEMEGIEVVEGENSYNYKNIDGISESFPLDFHSPYGCSKGAADQYVRDYARIYGIKTVVFRQSCIYGPRQFGVEDQGWVAWFIIALCQSKKITIYGDGKQVRDILFISDLVRAYDLAIDNISEISGQIYNIGGGKENSISVWYEFVQILEKLFRRKITANFSDWRPGDQKIYISDIDKAKKSFGWKPEVSPKEGMEKLYNWVRENKDIFN